MNDLSATESEQIVRECERIFLQIARLTDYGPQDSIAQLFTEDAQVDRDGKPVRGRAALQTLYSQRPPNLMTRHLVSNLLVTPLSTRDAVCQAIATVYRHRGADTSGQRATGAGMATATSGWTANGCARVAAGRGRLRTGKSGAAGGTSCPACGFASAHARFRCQEKS